MGYCVTCPLLYDISLWYYRKFQHDAACRQERMRRKCFYGWWWNEGEGRTWRTHGSVSEQKTWSDGRRQPMGCRRGGVVDTRDDGGDVAGGDVWRWVGKSAVGTGISTLSHRVSVQPSTTAEHTTVDSWALHARKTPKKNAHTQVQTHKDATPSPLQRTQTQSSPMRTARTSETTETRESAPNFASIHQCTSRLHFHQYNFRFFKKKTSQHYYFFKYFWIWTVQNNEYFFKCGSFIASKLIFNCSPRTRCSKHQKSTIKSVYKLNRVVYTPEVCNL